MPPSKPALLVLTALLASGCASMRPAASTPDAAEYHRLFLTMPSNADGFGTRPRDGVGRRTAERAFSALRFELIDAGFDVVAADRDADAILELTIGNIGPNGEAERAFVAFRDADRGRLVWVFRAQARAEPPSVEKLIEPIAEAIEEMVGIPAAPTSLR